MNSLAYNIVSENDTSMVIAHFDIDFVMNIIEDNLIRRIDIYQPSLPNIVSAIEQNFKILNVDAETGNVLSEEELKRRNDIYSKIISLLCARHNITINITQDDIDVYSLSYYLYDFLISNFRQYLISFFTTYIYKERNEIYNYLNLNDMKKSKDSSTVYGKKVYKNQKIAIINANIDYVVNSLCSFDITLPMIIGNIYNDKNVVAYLLNNIQEVQDFFKTVYVPIIQNNYYRQSIITDIRLALHQLAISTEN